MRIFISYSSSDAAHAAAISARLPPEYRVFFDDHALAPGHAYDEKIAREIAECDLFVFLLSPAALEPGGYALTELKIFQKRWRNPQGHLLVVMVRDVNLRSDDPVLAYLTAVTVLRPLGNVAAEVVREIAQLSAPRPSGQRPPARPDMQIVHELLQARDFQARREVGELVTWWRHYGREQYGGVCTLIGIGGSGKTALVERFLRSLPIEPPLFARQDDIPIDATLPAPSRLFVFSFYNVPNADRFFGYLGAWLAGGVYDEQERPSSTEEIRILLRATPPCLIVLDGLEKVQEDGLRGVFGRINDGRLRELVREVADGLFPGVRLLVTTRFRLYQRRAPNYHAISIDKLEPAVAIRLLRARGVATGSDAALAALASEHGNHALSVDLLGGLIARYYGGDPARLPAVPSLPQQNAAGVADPDDEELQEQERRFSRIAMRYRTLFCERDPDSLAVLEHICLFRTGVSEAVLVSIFQRRAHASLDVAAIHSKIALLSLMRLVEGGEDGRYTLHPAVRDGFLRGIAITNSRDGNRAVRDTLLAGLRTGPGAPPPTELTTLDEIEELIHHTLELDDVNEAWQLFEYRMGGFENLGWRLGAFERIDRILRRIAQHVPAPGASALGLVARRALEHAWARSLAARGEIAQAIARCTVVRDQGLYDGALIELDILAELYVLSGHLRHALECVEEALTDAKHQGDHEAKARTLGLLVHIQALRGKRLAAKQAAHGQAQRELDEPFFHVRRLPAMHHLTRLGELDEAARILERAEQVDRASWGGDGPAIQALALERAEIALAHGDHDHIEPRVRAVREWATQHDAKELLCWSGRLLIEQRLQAWHRGTALEPAELRAVLQLAMVEVDRARSNGLGLYHIDLRIQRARLRLLTGDPLAAIADLAIAFEDGLPADDSGPAVPAARQPSCKYAWGVADARRCLGHALLLYVAIDLGDAKGDPRTLLERPEVRAAIRELESARNVMHTMGDPRADEIERELEAVARGLLTASPLDRVVEPLAEADQLRATRVITAALAAAR